MRFEIDASDNEAYYILILLVVIFVFYVGIKEIGC